jgi:hypothetical protein
MEIWKKIENFDYYISNRGNLKNCKNKIMSNSTNKRGYIVNRLNANGIYKNHYRHRLVATYFIINSENKLTVNHIDGIKTNNNVNNLEWATKKEQELHAFKTNLKSNKGIKHSQNKLTEQEVFEIYKIMKSETMTGRAVAKKFNISVGVVFNIKHRRIWKHLDL